MATDIDAIMNNLDSFYDMSGKSVIHVGAGGGQFIRYADKAREVLAVDPDPDAVAHLKEAIQKMDLKDRFSVVQGEFADVSTPADVVFFEFCLHEMDDPAEALRHAQSLAPEIVVIDHHPESSWAWCCSEEEKAARSWAAVRRLGVAEESLIKAHQHFDTYQQLYEKIQILGEPSITRIGKHKGQENITISMDYAMARLRRDAAG